MGSLLSGIPAGECNAQADGQPLVEPVGKTSAETAHAADHVIAADYVTDPSTVTAPASWEAYDAAVARAWGAKFAGKFEEGLTESRLALAILLQLEDAPDYKIHGTRADVRIHEEIVSLVPGARREIHEADGMSQPIRTALRRKEFEKADSLTTRQLEIRARLLGPRAYDVAETQRFRAQILGAETRWAEADSLLLIATEIYNDYLGPRHPNLATILADQAGNAQEAGRRGDAEHFLQEGIALLRERGWENHPLYPLYAYSLTGLSVILKGQGELARAETAARQALALLDGHSDPQGRTAASHSALGQALYDQGRFEEAHTPLLAALEARARRVGWNDPDIARARVNLAANLRAQSRWDESEEQFRLAMALRDSLYGESSEYSARTRLALASLLDDRGRSKEAEALYARALATLGEEPDALRSWGDFLRRHGRVGEAEAAHRAALAEYRRREDPRFQKKLAVHLRSLAADLYSQRRFHEARSLLEEASVQFESARLAAGERFERATFEGTPYRLLAATHLALGDSVLAWEAAERSVGRAFLDILASQDRPVPPDVATRRQELLRKLDEAESRWSLVESVAEETVKRTSDPESDLPHGPDRRTTTTPTRVDRDTVRRALLRAQADWVAFQEEQRARFPFPGESTLGYDELRARLSEGEAILGWFDLELEGLPPQSWIYVVRTEGIRWFPHPAAGDPDRWSGARDEMRELRETLHGSTWSALGGDSDWREQLLAISRDRWMPALPALRSVERIVVVGTGALDGIPVDALLTGIEVGTEPVASQPASSIVPVEAHGEAFVVDRWAITTAPSASVHIWLAERSERPHPEPRSLFAVADPRFDSAAPAESEASPDRGSQPAGSRHAGSRHEWTPVPASRDEVRAIAPYFDHAELVLGADASESTLSERVESGALSRVDVLHFATHAFADDRNPDRSALVLAQTRRPGPSGNLWVEPDADGLLTAREIVTDWSLDAELVVLSACETALGRRIRGEGFVGLTQSFLLAGSRNVLASLWAVDDEATRHLMESFYREWIGERHSAPEALRNAKRHVRELEIDGQRPFAHPRHWAAFVWVGPGD